MATTIYHDADANLELVRAKRVAVVGYGNQGHAHALNLRDSGCEVCIGLRLEGASRPRAEADGFAVQSVAEATRWADIVSLLLPDQHHGSVFEASIRDHLEPGKLLMMGHGFSIHFGLLRPPAEVDVAMVAPVGPGHLMRRLYQEGSGIPALVAVHQDVTGEAVALSLAYARALGSTRAGVVRSSFQEETETDLFGEQAVLCGGLSALIRAGFQTLVGAGYQPELAYFECVHQMKFIVDLIYEGGLAGMHSRISDTAEYGAYTSGPRIVDDHVRQSMEEVLADIQDGSFARSWMEEYDKGTPTLHRVRLAERQEQLELMGRRIRSMMKATPLP